VYYTHQAGDAVRLAGQAQAEGASILVAVGGDGTVFEIVNGMDLSRSTLGLMPAGTGNDFCRSLRYPPDPYSVAENLLRWNSRQIDLGMIGGRYFVNVIGAGFDGQVADDINNRFRFLAGKAAYLAGILKNLVTYRNAPVEVEYDGRRWVGKALLIAIGNGSFYGGGFQIVPPALPDDGCFHVCLVKDVSKIETLRILPRVYRGGHVGHPEVEIFTARRITVKSAVPLRIQADGELLGTLPLSVEVAPRALRVLAPDSQETASNGSIGPAACQNN
jgi:diacylglycerol kinase (ATP)